MSRAAASARERRLLTGWGRTAPTMADVRTPRSVSDVETLVRRVGERGLAPRGLGRSYGDAAQNAGGEVLDMTALSAVIDIDRSAPSVTVQAGTSLDALMRTLLPLGLWIPVLPGTRQVTVGGAIAADIHGKNHHRHGSLGQHVLSLDLIGADGSTRTCSPDLGQDLFWATVGGMGLTGVVVAATLALHRVETSSFVVDTLRTADVDELLEVLAEGDDAYDYSVAWFDTTVTGTRLGRAVVTRGRSATVEDLPPRRRQSPLAFDARPRGAVPPHVPPGLVNRATARAFSAAWYAKAPRRRDAEVQDITQFFHPLDVIADWNRLYGTRGFCQYQFVVPFGQEASLRGVVELIAESPHVSCLNVLKRFGPADGGLLSFPVAGWTLAVDLPVAPGLDRLLRRLDDLVLGAGGRVYLAKDARLPRTSFETMYPRVEEFRAVRARVDPDSVFRTDLARRLGL